MPHENGKSLVPTPKTANERFWFLVGWEWAIMSADAYLTDDIVKELSEHGIRLLKELE